MISSTVWYVVIQEMIKSNIIRSKWQKNVAYFLYLKVLLIVGLGRMYISAHFPDQCLLGLICGLLLGMTIEKYVSIKTLKIKHHIWMASLMFASSYLTYELMSRLSTKDADWSVNLAKRWCFKPEYAKADTTPLYVVWRSAGTVIGVGFAFHFISTKLKKLSKFSSGKINFNSEFNTIVAIASVPIVWFYMKCTKPDTFLSNDLLLFYFKSFIQYTFLPSVGIVFVLFAFYARNSFKRFKFK